MPRASLSSQGGKGALDHSGCRYDVVCRMPSQPTTAPMHHRRRCVERQLLPVLSLQSNPTRLTISPLCQQLWWLRAHLACIRCLHLCRHGVHDGAPSVVGLRPHRSHRVLTRDIVCRGLIIAGCAERVQRSAWGLGSSPEAVRAVVQQRCRYRRGQHADRETGRAEERWH